MNTNDVRINIGSKDEEKSAKIIQSLYKRNKYKDLFRSKVHFILKSPDTLRITSGKFQIPLYIVQQTFFQMIFGKKKWETMKKIIENYKYMSVVLCLWIVSIITSNLYIYRIYNSNAILLISIIYSFPSYIIYLLSIQSQLLYVITSTFDFRLYTLFSILVCISLSDLFRDSRNYIVWFNLFPCLLLLSFNDTVPRYLVKGRTIMMIMFYFSVIYLYILMFGILFGWIHIFSREIIVHTKNKNIYKDDTDNTINTFSSVSNCISLIQGFIILILKTLLWYVLSPHKAIVLKSTTLITGVSTWKMPKKLKGKYKYYVEKKIKISNDDHHLKQLQVKPHFGLFHTF